MDLPGELDPKDDLVYVEILAQWQSSPFQEAQGHLAQLESQGCKENVGSQGRQEAQDPVGQEVNQARTENQELLVELEKKATKAAKESKDHLDWMDDQV